jgi:uncharacterized SAM-binding protein YcdF (DUF218 family)
VIIVTSNYHTRRVRYIYDRIFPGPIAVSVASARDADFDPGHWWQKKKSIKLFAHEFLGMLEAFWELHGKEKGAAAAAVPWLDRRGNLEVT